MRAFRALQADPKPTYDVVVIGAGIGGLICAGLLARDGLKVLLVEQHYMVGGYCSTFHRGAFTFDAATHFYPLLGNPMTITGAVLEKLGSRTRWVKMDPVDHFHFPDGSSFSVSADFDEYIDELKATFPHEADALDKFFLKARDAYLYGLLYYFRGREHERFGALQHLTLQQVLDTDFKDRKLRLLLAGRLRALGLAAVANVVRLRFDAAAVVFPRQLLPGRRIAGVRRRPRAHRAGGRRRHPDAFDGRAHCRRAGRRGRRRNRDRARCGPAHRSRQRRTHRFERGSQIDARADARSVDRRRAGDSGRQRAATDQPLLPGALRTARHRAVGCSSRQPATTGARGTRTMSCTTRSRFSSRRCTSRGWRRPAGRSSSCSGCWRSTTTRSPIGERTKQRIEDDLLARLEAEIPGVTSHVVTRQSASALTSWRFTLNLHGAMLGWEMSPDQFGPRRPGD